MQRKMHLIGYIAVPTCHSTGMWRHPLTTTHLLDRSLFESVARTMEEGLFDMVFMPDSIAVSDTYGGNFRATVEYGAQTSFLPDPVITLMAMASVTRHLGLGVTMSTSYVEPYNIARQLSTLDLLSGGRAAWNIVTSSGMYQARNFSRDYVLPPVERYDRADEVCEVVTGLWKSWDRDAVVIDKEMPRFVDPDKVRYLHHEGPNLKVQGPLSLPRSPQGHPVLMQAGASDRGLAFGTRWGEFIFAIQHSVEDMKKLRDELRRRAEAADRDPESVKMAPAIQAIIGETEQIAKEKQAYMRELVPLPGAMALLSAHSGLDLGRFAPTTPIAEVVEELGGAAARGTAALLLQAHDRGMSTIGEAVREFGTSELTPQIVGTPEQVAEQLAEIFKAEATDGFVLTPTEMPGTYESFVRGVVPYLQRMGLFRTRYEGTTLRENLGLPIPD